MTQTAQPQDAAEKQLAEVMDGREGWQRFHDDRSNEFVGWERTDDSELWVAGGLYTETGEPWWGIWEPTEDDPDGEDTHMSFSNFDEFVAWLETAERHL